MGAGGGALPVSILADSLVVGGAERVVQALALELPRHGVAAAVGCLRGPGPVGDELVAAGVPLRPHISPGPRDPRGLWRTRRWLRSTGARVVYCLDHGNALWWGRLAARSLGLPVVVAVHRTGRADGSRSLGRADRLLLPWTDAVVAVSEGHRRYLEEVEGLEPALVRVVHNGVDPALYGPPLEGEARASRRRELGIPADRCVVVHVAAFRPEKEHPRLLRALASLPPGERPFLAFAGDGPGRPHAEVEARRLGLGSDVAFLGLRPDIPRVLPACDGLVLASRPSVETFPMAVLEAMASGLCVLSTDVGSLRELVVEGETGWLVPALDDGALAAGLSRFAAQPSRRRELGAAGAARVRARFTREKMVEGTARLLYEVAGVPAAAGA